MAVIGAPSGQVAARTRAFARGEVEGLLTSIRRERESAQQLEELQLDRLAALLPAARAVAFSFEAISELSGVSRPTLNRLREPNRASWADAELAVLLGLAIDGPQTKQQLSASARRFDLGKERELGAAVDVLLTRGVLATFQAGFEGGLTTFLRLTESGREALTARLNHLGIGERFRWSVYFSVDANYGQVLEAAGEARLGTGEVALLYPGQGPNEHWEVAFMVRASTQDQALAEGHRQFADLCRACKLDPPDVAGGVFLLPPVAT